MPCSYSQSSATIKSYLQDIIRLDYLRDLTPEQFNELYDQCIWLPEQAAKGSDQERKDKTNLLAWMQRNMPHLKHPNLRMPVKALIDGSMMASEASAGPSTIPAIKTAQFQPPLHFKQEEITQEEVEPEYSPCAMHQPLPEVMQALAKLDEDDQRKMREKQALAEMIEDHKNKTAKKQAKQAFANMTKEHKKAMQDKQASANITTDYETMQSLVGHLPAIQKMQEQQSLASYSAAIQKLPKATKSLGSYVPVFQKKTPEKQPLPSIQSSTLEKSTSLQPRATLRSSTQKETQQKHPLFLDYDYDFSDAEDELIDCSAPADSNSPYSSTALASPFAYTSGKEEDFNACQAPPASPIFDSGIGVNNHDLSAGLGRHFEKAPTRAAGNKATNSDTHLAESCAYPAAPLSSPTQQATHAMQQSFHEPEENNVATTQSQNAATTRSAIETITSLGSELIKPLAAIISACQADDLDGAIVIAADVVSMLAQVKISHRGCVAASSGVEDGA